MMTIKEYDKKYMTPRLRRALQKLKVERVRHEKRERELTTEIAQACIARKLPS